MESQMNVSTVPMPVLTDVEVEPGEHGFKVTPVWAGVDRPRSYSVWVTSEKNANRLKAAIFAGVAITVRGILMDVHGQTYADTQNHFLGRRLNADLKRLGY
jgi:hypothetical protein